MKHIVIMHVERRDDIDLAKVAQAVLRRAREAAIAKAKPGAGRSRRQ
jgi:hypothetical protein